MNFADRLSRLRQRKFMLLLVSLLLLAVLHPVTEGRFIGGRTYDALFSVFLMTAIFTASQRRWPFLFALTVGTPAIVLTWVAEWAAVASPEWYDALVLARQIAYLMFLVFAVLDVLRHVLRAEQVTADKLCGAVCVYLLLGITWANIYSIAEHVQPGSFALAGNVVSDNGAGNRDVFSQLTYYSFVTLTTLGYGDVTPASTAARTFSWLEALVGQIYLAVLLARLVGLHIIHTTPEPNEK